MTTYVEEEEDLAGSWARWRNRHRNSKARLVWAFMNVVKISFLTEQTLRNEVEICTLQRNSQQ